jgi:hypothetical protein
MRVDNARYSSCERVGTSAFRSRYLGENLPTEENIECWFGEPIVSGDRAAVEWWGSWRERGQELTFAGVTVPRFDDHGKVIDHRDYDNHVEWREPPYAGW